MKKILIILIIIALGLFFLSQLRILPAGVRFCGRLVALDFGAAVDGPLYYYDLFSFKKIANCGGYCMLADCTGLCPPKEWTCSP